MQMFRGSRRDRCNIAKTTAGFVVASVVFNPLMSITEAIQREGGAYCGLN